MMNQMKMTTKMTVLRLSDISLDDKLRIGIARFQLSAAQAYCGSCNIYLTMFAQWDEQNYAKATAELLKHKRECHAEQTKSKD